MGFAEAILLAVGAYTLVGSAFGLVFVIMGVGKVDHAAVGAPWSFRVLIWHGAAALWPLMLAKWARAARSHAGERP